MNYKIETKTKRDLILTGYMKTHLLTKLTIMLDLLVKTSLIFSNIKTPKMFTGMVKGTRT